MGRSAAWSARPAPEPGICDGMRTDLCAGNRSQYRHLQHGERAYVPSNTRAQAGTANLFRGAPEPELVEWLFLPELHGGTAGVARHFRRYCGSEPIPNGGDE